MSSSKPERMSIVATIAIAVAVVLLFVILFINMFIGDSSYKSTGGKVSSVDVLNCTTNTNIEAFFSTDIASEVNHKITITFSDGYPDKISYNVSASYHDEDSFNREGRIWVTDYGLYMGNNNLKEDSINNTFSSLNNKAWVSFYTEMSNINAVTAKIFLFNENNYLAVRNYDIVELGQYYNSLGFTCEQKINKEINEK